MLAQTCLIGSCNARCIIPYVLEVTCLDGMQLMAKALVIHVTRDVLCLAAAAACAHPSKADGMKANNAGTGVRGMRRCANDDRYRGRIINIGATAIRKRCSIQTSKAT